MGFYGNAIYYMPNGIAQDVVDGVITTAKINDGAVTTIKINDGAVTEDKINDGAVTEDKIDTGAVTEDKINDGAVTEDKIDTGAVTKDKINDGAVTTTKIMNNAITADKIDTGAVTEDKINDGAVTTTKIMNNAITEDKIDTDAVTRDKIKDGEVTELKLSKNYIIYETYTWLGDNEGFNDLISKINNYSAIQTGFQNLPKIKFIPIYLFKSIDTNDNNITLSKGWWIFTQQSQTDSDSKWLFINMSSLETYHIEIDQEEEEIKGTIQSTNFIQKNKISINSLSDWKNIQFNPNFIYTIDFTTSIDLNVNDNEKQSLLGEYLGFTFATDEMYLMDKNGALIKYDSTKEQFVLLSSTYIIDNIPQGSIGVDKLNKPCVYIEELEVDPTKPITALDTLFSILNKQLEKNNDNLGIIYTFTPTVTIGSLQQDIPYYFTPLLSDNKTVHWQVQESPLNTTVGKIVQKQDNKDQITTSFEAYTISGMSIIPKTISKSLFDDNVLNYTESAPQLKATYQSILETLNSNAYKFSYYISEGESTNYLHLPKGEYLLIPPLKSEAFFKGLFINIHNGKMYNIKEWEEPVNALIATEITGGIEWEKYSVSIDSVSAANEYILSIQNLQNYSIYYLNITGELTNIDTINFLPFASKLTSNAKLCIHNNSNKSLVLQPGNSIQDGENTITIENVYDNGKRESSLTLLRDTPTIIDIFCSYSDGGIVELSLYASNQ